MKKKLILFSFFLMLVLSLQAQVISDANDPLYQKIHQWHERGWINRLPELAPYPLPTVIMLLEQVVDKGDEKARTEAERDLDWLKRPFTITPELFHLSQTANLDYYGLSGAGPLFQGMIMENLSLSSLYRVVLVDSTTGPMMPEGTREQIDYLQDWSNFDLAARRYQILQGLFSLIAWGNATLYFQTGISRSSFGSFYEDGAVLSPQAPQAGRFSLTWMHDLFTYHNLLLSLTATSNQGKGRYPGKYLILHSLTFYPLPWLEAGAWETVVFGKRFEPLYLIPFGLLFYEQGLLGFPDNSLAGLSLKVKLPQAVNMNLTLYMDDMHFNDLIRLNFETKYKLAFQGGVSWTPLYPLLQRISLDYLAVMPYMYTHREAGGDPAGVNYQNYTQMGVNLGPGLEPNSDRLSLALLLSPWDRLKTALLFRYIRHANASLGYTDGDGSLFDDGYDADGQPTFQHSTRFLSQAELEHTLQWGVKAQFSFPLYRKDLTTSLGYLLEWKHFSGQNSINHYFSLEAEYLF